MKRIFKVALLTAIALMLIPDDIYAQYGIRRRTARRTAVVVGSTTAHAASASTAAAQQQAAAAQQQSAAAQQQAAQQTAAAQQQAAAAQQQAAAAEQRAAASEQEAAAARHAAAVAQGLLPLGTVAYKLPAGCTTIVVSDVVYYQCGLNYYRTVFQGNNLVYVTAQPK